MKIEVMLTITKECTVADVVSNNIKTADIFKKHGIDFCCGGGVSLDKICDKKGVSYNVLSEEFKFLDGSYRKYTSQVCFG